MSIDTYSQEPPLSHLVSHFGDEITGSNMRAAIRVVRSPKLPLKRKTLDVANGRRGLWEPSLPVLPISF